MPKIDRTEAAKIIKDRFPKSKVIIIPSATDRKTEKLKNAARIADRLSKSSSKKRIIKLAKNSSKEYIIKTIENAVPSKSSSKKRTSQTIENTDKNQKKVSKIAFFLRQHSRLLLLLSPLAICSLLLINSIRPPQASDSMAAPNADTVPIDTGVVAPGTIIPKGEIIKLSVANAEDSRVNKILVSEGDRVRKNQVIAVLQGVEKRERDLEEAQNTVGYHKAKLRQTKTGEENSDPKIQETKIASSEVEYNQAKLTYDRHQTLLAQGVISQKTFDESKRDLDIATAALNREKQNLSRLVQTKAANIEMAEIELKGAIIALEQRRADLEDTRVRVPVSGQILRINAQEGEQVDTNQGIVELGRTDQMYVSAEVYETDINRVEVGQPAIISSEYGGFTGKLKGQIEHIGLKIGSKKISNISQDPTQDENSRIVEVKIRLNREDSRKVAGLTDMKVRVQIGKPN